MALAAIPLQGVLRVVPPAQYEEALRRQAEERVKTELLPVPDMSMLASYVRTQWEIMRNHRNSASGWNERLLEAMRAFNGEYNPTKLAEIRKFKGSEVYARIIAMKCRGASSLLRDIYIAPERAWALRPPADPDIPPEIIGMIHQLISVEIQTLMQAGQPLPDAGVVRDRTMQLLEGARIAEKKNAQKRAEIAQDRIDEILEEGGFYTAMAEFLVDLPLFPFACIKGPVVRIVPTVSWENGQATVIQQPKLFWNRISPFDIYWSPGVSHIEDASTIERTRLTRGELNDLLDLPGYNHDAIRAVLDEYGRGGLHDNWDSTDSERAVYESREAPQQNRTGMIACLEFNGNVQGRMLLEYGFGPDQVPDPIRDYMVQLWMIGRHVIKVQLTPSPRKRHPYYISSFEKVPGTPVGNGLPDILSDIQEVANAALRALVNNLAISSGPQVVVNDDRLAPGEDGDDLYPWKRWHMISDPLANNSQPAVDFFQPNSNAAELLTVYQKFSEMADELSAIPRYLSGQGAVGGAGRTAAGLAMLMGNASKILQTVAANIDRDVMAPALNELYDMLMLTDQTGVLRGDESIRVMGVNVAVQRETERSRQLEFLQITANPVDMQIIGPQGRAAVLRSVASTIGLDGEEIVPSEEKLAMIEQQMAEAAVPPEEAAGKAQGSQRSSAVTGDMGPRVRLDGGVG